MTNHQTSGDYHHTHFYTYDFALSKVDTAMYLCTAPGWIEIRDIQWNIEPIEYIQKDERANGLGSMLK